MRHGSLFSGIGGFDLAAEWMGWDNVFHCEWNEFGQRVLKYHFPNSISYNDITKTDFTIHRGQIDILTGGFPCQPYSQAGKRLGKADDRHLWPEMLRAIREIQPTWVVGENVRGLTNWNGGVVFDEVQADLEAAGYEVTPFLLPACAVNAPHRRDRVWFVAFNPKSIGDSEVGKVCNWKNNEPIGICRKDNERPAPHTDCNGCDKCNGNNEKHTGKGRQYARNDVEPIAANAKRVRRDAFTNDNGKFTEAQQKERREKQLGGTNSAQDWWWDFPTQPPVCGGDDGLPRELDGITLSKWRSESIKAYGNAIVPQVALQIFKAIAKYEN